MTKKKPRVSRRLVTQYVARKKDPDMQLVNVVFSLPLLARIDRQAQKSGVSRSAWFRLRLVDLLDAAERAE
jgi:hypothetical protein